MTERVAVNMLWCRPGLVGGSEEYLTRQLCGLATAAPGLDVRIHCTADFAHAHRDLASHHTFELARQLPAGRVGRIVQEHSWLARSARGADLIHHGGGTVPMIGTEPIVSTVHDLQYLRYPEYFGRSRLAYLRAMMPRSVHRADVVAVPTSFVRDTVVEAFGADPERVVVVPHGVGGARPADADVRALRARCGLEGRRVLVYPAITHPHKGHRFLLELMRDRWTEPDLHLVLLGGPGAAERDVRRAIAEAGLDDRVHRPGRVAAHERDQFIAMAEALVFPSEYEGFGAPLIEAMRLGTPVICADQPALAEVAGSAGLVVPREPDAWAHALEMLPGRRSDLIADGFDRSGSFTEEISGRALASAYRQALA